MRIARDMEYRVKEVSMSPAELYDADEVFITSTGVGVVPVVEIDNRVIGNGRPGEISQALRRTYSDAACGRVPEYDEWLAYV